jgi:hypothetical protein
MFPACGSTIPRGPLLFQELCEFTQLHSQSCSFSLQLVSPVTVSVINMLLIHLSLLLTEL